jgi:uncharacterized protein
MGCKWIIFSGTITHILLQTDSLLRGIDMKNTCAVICLTVFILAAAEHGFAAGEEDLIKAVKNSDRDEIISLLNKGRNINGVYDYETPLIVAINQLDADMMQFLIDKKADVNFRVPGYDTSPLTHLLTVNSAYTDFIIKAAKTLIKSGADVNIRDFYGRTPLMHSVNNRSDMSVIKLLIDNKAGVNSVTESGETALFIASENNFPEIASSLMKSGANDRIFKKIDRFQICPIHNACEKGHVEVVRAILENGGNVNIQSKGSFGGQTPMHYAVTNRNVELVKLLLKYKPDLSLADSAGGTALYYSTHGGGPELAEIIGLLRKAGAR